MGPWPDDAGGLDHANVAFLYVGPVEDHGWTRTHDDGRIYLEEHLDGVETEYAASVSSADAGDVMEAFIEAGDNVIFTTSFDFLTPTLEVAGNNQDVLFESCSGFVSMPNLGSYFGRMQQAWYLAGIVAGKMTTQNHIGSVSPVTIPETVRHLNAFALGVRSVNPEAVIEVKWIGAWFDTELEPQVTVELLENGADIIASETDTTIPLGVVQAWAPKGGLEYPVYSIGYDNPDSCAAVGDRCLTSPYWNWGPLYTRLVSSMLDGSWNPYEVIWESIQTDREKSIVYLAEINTVVPATVRMDVAAVLADLARGENSQMPFVGPILDNQGTLRVAAGDEMTDEEMLRICWFVDGIVDANGDPARVPAGCGGDS
jgi:basic membrane protein A